MRVRRRIIQFFAGSATKIVLDSEGKIHCLTVLATVVKYLIV